MPAESVPRAMHDRAKCEKPRGPGTACYAMQSELSRFKPTITPPPNTHTHARPCSPGTFCEGGFVKLRAALISVASSTCDMATSGRGPIARAAIACAIDRAHSVRVVN